MSAPRFTDGRIVVRALEEKDVEPYMAAFVDEGEPLLNLCGFEEPPPRERVERWLERYWVDPPDFRSWEFVIAEAGSDEFLGTIMVHSCDWWNKRAEVGAWIREQRATRVRGPRRSSCSSTGRSATSASTGSR